MTLIFHMPCPECQQNPVGPTLEINPQTDHFSSPLFLPPLYVIISQRDYYNNVSVASPFQSLSPNSPFSSEHLEYSFSAQVIICHTSAQTASMTFHLRVKA